jgi:HEPN domain-containing protein
MTENEKQKEQISYWLNLAQYDLETAETLLNGERFLYVGFMCHQVIEKTLKAHYVNYCNATPPYHHNLGFFAKESGLLEKFSEERKALISNLQPMNIEARYPSHKDKIFQALNQDRCALLLSQTRELYLWLRSQL